jgi:hypothetical protein
MQQAVTRSNCRLHTLSTIPSHRDSLIPLTASNICRHRTRFLFLYNPNDLLVAEPAAFDWSVSLRNRLYRKLATFQVSTSSGYMERSQLCAQQKGPELIVM